MRAKETLKRATDLQSKGELDAALAALRTAEKLFMEANDKVCARVCRFTQISVLCISCTILPYYG
jgi:hypothetical protein